MTDDEQAIPAPPEPAEFVIEYRLVMRGRGAILDANGNEIAKVRIGEQEDPAT